MMTAFKRSSIRLAVPLCLLLTLSGSYCQDQLLHFPDDFWFGATTASYQVEGAWNVSDKGENVWDHFTHQKPSPVWDKSTGDVSADSYHKWREDVQLLKNLGVNSYRFSLSWSRILPTGYANVVSQDGINYYKNLINELLANGIEPCVTLYHWDHPQVIEELGGWTNELTVSLFVDYARVVFKELGPKVKHFSTINEARVVCVEGYEQGVKAPGKVLNETGKYLCMHNLLKAHASVYHLYDKEFRPQQNGYISVVIPCNAYFPKTRGVDDEAAEIAFQFDCGWIAHPIFSKTGDYPEVMKKRIAENSKLQGYPRSQLPEFSPEWVKYIKGSADYFSLNHYTSNLAEALPHKNGDLWLGDSGIRTSVDPNWPSTIASWLKVVPKGIRNVLNKIKNEYGNPVVFITENGYPDSGTLQDVKRINYLYDYLKEVLKAIHVDGCKVESYYVWSLIDNFEWEKGYLNSFGMVHVDFNSPNRTRTPKQSAKWYKGLTSSRVLSKTYPVEN